MMAFHYLMEPVFDRLGMKLVSRNMAQGGVGTTHSAMGGGDIYGEKDIMWWDSGMTERDKGAIDLFNKQALLGGERVPILMNSPLVDLVADSNGTAWIGVVNHPDTSQFQTESDEQAEKDIPFALRYLHCDGDTKQRCQEEKYSAVCWEDRSDCVPPTAQAAHPGSQVSWHPGFRHHQLTSRANALLVLHALDDAIQKWKAIIVEMGAKKAHPLPEEHWHVREHYVEIQEKVRTHMSTMNSEEGEGESTMNACEKTFNLYPRVCRVEMSAFGEWTPRASPETSSLRNIMVGEVPEIKSEILYHGIDVLAPEQKIPKGQVDVHAIAIATTRPAPEADSNSSVPPADEAERRMLIEATADVSKRRMEHVRRAMEEAGHGGGSGALKEDAEGGRRRSGGDKNDKKNNLRSLTLAYSDEITPGPGWGWTTPTGNLCDGSYNSECTREPSNNCLLNAHNDARKKMVGDAMAGWLVMRIPKVREGLILLRMEWWTTEKDPFTEGWTEVGIVPPPADDHDPSDNARRSLGGRVSPMPDDMKFEVAIDGKIVKTWDHDEFMSYGKEVVKNFALWPLLDEVEWAKGNGGGKDVEVAIRLRSEAGRECQLGVSHVYYA